MDEIIRQDPSEKEYRSLLRQVVAVIDNTRQTVAKLVNSNVTSAYWEIGKLLYEKKIENNKHGGGVV